MITAQCYLRGWSKPVARNRVAASFIEVGLILACIYFWPTVEQFIHKQLEVGNAWQLLKSTQDSVAAGIVPAADIADINYGVFRLALYRWFLYTGYCIPGAAIIYWFSCSTGILARSLNSSVLVLLGNLSFALFLCHQPIILWLEPLIAPWGFAPGIALLLCTLLVLTVSVLLYFLIERPSANLFRRQSTGKKTIPQDSSGRPMGNEVGGWLLLATVVVISYALQSRLPALHHVEFSNGLSAYVNSIDSKADHLVISIAWRAEQPLEGELWAIQALESGENAHRIRVAKFKSQNSGIAPFGFKTIRIPEQGKKQFRFVKLVFIDHIDNPPDSFQVANSWPNGNSTIWSNGPLPTTEFYFENGLIVCIDRVEMKNHVLAVDLRWSTQEAIDGLLFFRRLDGMDQPLRYANVNRFSMDDSREDLSGRKQFFFDFQESPTMHSIDLTFGRKGKGLVRLEPNWQRDRRRITIWKRPQ
jgi:hypothetical protein